MSEHKKRQGELPESTLKVAIGVVVVIVVAVVLVLALLWSSRPHPTPIASILGNLREFDTKIVTVEGTVGTPMNVLGMKFYDVTDSTGTIKVVTQRGLPSAGEVVVVNGVVNQVFEIAGISYTVIVEPAETT